MQPITRRRLIIAGTIIVGATVLSTLVAPPTPPKLVVPPIRTYLPTLIGPPRQKNPIGVWLGYGGNSTSANMLKGTNADHTRIPFHWSIIQLKPSTWDFSHYDIMLKPMAQNGISPILEFRDAPTWASTTRCGPIDQPGGLDAFTLFVRTSVQRYSASPYNVRMWELYNEPEVQDPVTANKLGLGCWGNTPSDYVATLQVFYKEIKKINPKADVLLGGLIFQPGQSEQWARDILTAGAGPWFDVGNVHYYSYPTGPYDQYGIDIIGKLEFFRRTMAIAGVVKPIAVTEVGYKQTGSAFPTFRQDQAAYIPKVIARAISFGIYDILWFSLTDPGDLDFPYGLIDSKGVPKPCYYAWAYAATTLGPTTYEGIVKPGDLGVTGGIEGYKFVQGNTRVWVVWTTGADLAITLPKGTWQLTVRLDSLLKPAPSKFLLTKTPLYIWLGDVPSVNKAPSGAQGYP